MNKFDEMIRDGELSRDSLMKPDRERLMREWKTEGVLDLIMGGEPESSIDSNPGALRGDVPPSSTSGSEVRHG